MFDNKNILLYPLSLVYGLITGIRNFLYNSGIFHSVEFHIPVICIGNITIGGTGKTPHTEYVTELLRKEFKVVVLSRGYKRVTDDFRIATPVSGVLEVGDEPLQISRKFQDVVVAVDRNRVNGVKRILKEYPETGVVILDDGFQHRKIKPGLTVLLTDFERLMTRDQIIPFGSLREGIGNIARANIILITKTPENLSPIQRRLIAKEIKKLPYQNIYFTSIVYKELVAVFIEGEKTNFEITNECGIVLITGIANPKSLVGHFKSRSSELIHLPFPDHYNFNDMDMVTINDAFGQLKSKVKYLITTEKDAVRLKEFNNIAGSLKSAFFYIPIEIKFLNNDKDEFDNLILDYVRKNRRNNRISDQ